MATSSYAANAHARRSEGKVYEANFLERRRRARFASVQDRVHLALFAGLHLRPVRDDPTDVPGTLDFSGRDTFHVPLRRLPSPADTSIISVADLEKAVKLENKNGMWVVTLCEIVSGVQERRNLMRSIPRRIVKPARQLEGDLSFAMKNGNDAKHLAKSLRNRIMSGMSS